jgi:hypothetical protein
MKDEEEGAIHACGAWGTAPAQSQPCAHRDRSRSIDGLGIYPPNRWTRIAVPGTDLDTPGDFFAMAERLLFIVTPYNSVTNEDY